MLVFVMHITVDSVPDVSHDDVIKWKHFPRYWPFVRGIHRSPVNSPHKGQWRGALMFTLICTRINGWVNNREAGDLRRYRAHYDVIVMIKNLASLEGLKSNRRVVSYSDVLPAIFRHNTYTRSLNHWSHGFENFAIFNRRACHWLLNRFAGGDRMSLYCQVVSNALHLINIALIKPINGGLAPVRSLVVNVTADTISPRGAKPSASMAITSKSEVS